MIVAEVLDPRELELPPVGQLVLVDPESGRQRDVATGDLPGPHRVRRGCGRATGAATAEAVRAAGAGHLQLRTDRDWVGELARFVRARRRLPARRRRCEEHRMTFLSPLWLLALLPVAALALAYVVVQRRRHRYAVRFASLPMLERVVPRRPGWRRHVPAALVLVALTALGLAAARPELALRVPYDRATVMVAIDTSGSMGATDVPPTRLDAAKAAADAFVEDLPDTVNVGVVSFAGASSVLAAADHRPRPGPAADPRPRPGAAAAPPSVRRCSARWTRWSGSPRRPRASRSPPAWWCCPTAPTPPGARPSRRPRRPPRGGLPVSTITYGTPEGIVDGPTAGPSRCR